MRSVSLLREALFIFVHPFFAAFVDDALRVAENDVLALHAEAHVMLGAGDARRSRAVEDHAHFADVFADNLQSIQQGGAGNDRGAVLVVVKDGNLHRLARGSSSIWKQSGALMSSRLIPPKVGSSNWQSLMISSGSWLFTSMSKTSTSAKRLKRTALPSMTGLPARAPMSPRPSTAVPLLSTATRLPRAGVLEGVLRILLDFKAGLGNAGRVGQAQIALRAARLGGRDFNLSGTRPVVIIEGLLLAD